MPIRYPIVPLHIHSPVGNLARDDSIIPPAYLAETRIALRCTCGLWNSNKRKFEPPAYIRFDLIDPSDSNRVIESLDSERNADQIRRLDPDLLRRVPLFRLYYYAASLQLPVGNQSEPTTLIARFRTRFDRPIGQPLWKTEEVAFDLYPNHWTAGRWRYPFLFRGRSGARIRRPVSSTPSLPTLFNGGAPIPILGGSRNRLPAHYLQFQLLDRNTHAIVDDQDGFDWQRVVFGNSFQFGGELTMPAKSLLSGDSSYFDIIGYIRELSTGRLVEDVLGAVIQVE